MMTLVEQRVWVGRDGEVRVEFWELRYRGNGDPEERPISEASGRWYLERFPQEVVTVVCVDDLGPNVYWYRNGRRVARMMPDRRMPLWPRP